MNDEYSVINKIRQISNDPNNSSKHIINEIIAPIELDSLEELLKSNENGYSNVMDVPIQNIISLNRIDDTWFNGDSWLDALNKRLHGTEWSEKVFDYYENIIDKQEFPAPNARGFLELNSYNGMIHCGNGNHRLIAGVCWLASKYGDTKAILEKVQVFVIPFNKDRILGLKELYKTYSCGIKISKSELTDYQKELFQTNEDKIIMIDNKLYTLSNKSYKLLFQLKEYPSDQFFNSLDKMKYDKQKIIIDQDWNHISDYTLQKLFENKDLNL